jgi:Zn ribbon nucleic-acid-binding protein
MTCPECGSDNTRSEGTEMSGVEYFECLACGHQFDETEADQ